MNEMEDQIEETSKQAVDEASRLQQLGATGRAQDDLEKNIGREADEMLLKQATERDEKRLEKTQSQKQKLSSQIKNLEQRIRDPSKTTPAAATRIEAEIQQLRPQLESLDRDMEQIQSRMVERAKEGAEASQDADQAGNTRRPGESRRDFLIRTGKITPFSKIGQDVHKTSENLAEVMMDAEEIGESDLDPEEEDARPGKLLSHRNLLKPGYEDEDASQTDGTLQSIDDRPRKKRKTEQISDREQSSEQMGDTSEGDYHPEDREDPSSQAEQEEDDEDFAVVSSRDARKARPRKRKPARRKIATADVSDDVSDTAEDLTGLDDGNEQIYESRLRKWTKGRRTARRKAQAKQAENDTADEVDGQATDGEDTEEEKEWLMPHPTRPDTVYDGNFRIPGDIYPSLFDYQKTGVQWLSELYSQQVGGIVGDEMGLGKTIQIIAFLAGLHHSNRLNKPMVIVTPATVMKQWVNEFHRWWPPLRVSILHTSGSGMMNIKSERAMEDRLEAGHDGSVLSGSASRAAKKVVNRVLKQGHVLVTTYAGLQTYAELLLPIDWGYAVLDEGHKIRNPNAKITIYTKSLRTPNRVILSGTPMQNNLTELWSLFDFVFPLRLGTLVSFRTQFEIPIKQGGYANASNLQVETALKCAETLKDTISPYLLQRFKIDVAADLPKKSEQVLFCRLTKKQREAYEEFLRSSDLTAIMEGKRHALYGIDIMRKICNHPDLQDHRTLSVKAGYNYGNGAKSGKMQVVKALLELWRDTGHKTLLFAQHRIMLDILEKFLRASTGFKFRRMDGTTPIKGRQDIVDEFNNDPEIHVFLLTTKVGGLGVNLTGADRVIIYDPDWNPSTDMQARERSWRLGQKREVMIYRLMTAGTIEEKIYHRQIFKQFLTNKILRDPKQRQTFQLKDLHDLFSLGNAEDDTETGGIFQGTEVKFDTVSAAAHGNKEADADDKSLPTPPEDNNQDQEDSSKINAIVGISHRENFNTGTETTTPNPQPTAPNPSNDPSGTSTPNAPANNNDSRIMSSLFSRSGVHSALEHDAIVASSSKGKVTADPTMIAREAKRVAAAAARELKLAGEAAVNNPVGVPTWTGSVGSAGRPGERQPPSRQSHSPPSGRGRGATTSNRGNTRGGPSSSSILSNLAARQQGPTTNSRSSTPGAGTGTNDEAPLRGKDFMTQIRNYLVAHGGSCYTQMLIDHFNRVCRTQEQTAEFKEMLRAIAVLERGGGGDLGGAAGSGRGGMARESVRGGRGKWVLRREFGGTA